MHWERPVAWLGAVMAVGGSALLTIALMPAVAVQASDTARTYELLAQGMSAIGAPLDGRTPVIHDFPIWLAEAERVPTLALPDETPSDVLDLAAAFGAEWLVTAQPDHGEWPDVLAAADDPAAACFTEMDLPTPPNPADAALLTDVRVFRITCPTSP